MHKALLIHPDKVQRVTLRHALESTGNLEFAEVENDLQAQTWLEKSTEVVDYLFTPWECTQEKKDRLTAMRAVANASQAMLFEISSRQDIDWITTLFHAPGIVEAINAKPFRISTFLKTVQAQLTVDLLAKPCALVVDDEPEVREVVRDYLREFGFSKVLEASHGGEAMHLLEVHRREVSLVLSDWQMPGMTGIELLKALRATPSLRRLPFVIVTSKTPTEQVKTIQAAEMGVNGYLLKPFSLNTFRSQMESVMQETARHRRAEAYLIAGRTLMAQGNPKAEETLQEGVKLFPLEASLWEALGDSYCLKGRDLKGAAQAAENYEQSLKLAPLNTPLVMKCFEVYSVLGRMNDAVRLLRGQFQRSEHDDGFYTRLGKVYLQNGEIDAACREFRKAIAANPTNTEAQSLFQSALSMTGEFKKAS